MKKTQEELWNLLDNYESYYFECANVSTYYIYPKGGIDYCIKIETLDHEWLTEVNCEM